MYNFYVFWMIKILNIWLYKIKILLKINVCYSYKLKIVSFLYVCVRMGYVNWLGFYVCILFWLLNNVSLGNVNKFLV